MELRPLLFQLAAFAGNMSMLDDDAGRKLLAYNFRSCHNKLTLCCIILVQVAAYTAAHIHMPPVPLLLNTALLE